jgi:hypothetical protein
VDTGDPGWHWFVSKNIRIAEFSGRMVDLLQNQSNFFFRRPSAEGVLVVDLLRYLAYKVTKKQGTELNTIWWKDKQQCEWRWMKI